MKTIYTLIIINENIETCRISSYSNKQDAVKELEADYHRMIDMLASEGWSKEDLDVAELGPEHYFIQCGESSYYAEVKAEAKWNNLMGRDE